LRVDVQLHLALRRGVMQHVQHQRRAKGRADRVRQRGEIREAVLRASRDVASDTSHKSGGVNDARGGLQRLSQIVLALAAMEIFQRVRDVPGRRVQHVRRVSHVCGRRAFDSRAAAG